jgi:membrane protease YdiL (CAAX protease family)
MKSYAPHDRYVAPAKESADLGRLIIGFALIEAAYYVSQRAFSLLLILIGETVGPSDLEPSYEFGDTALGLLLQLFSFGFLGLAVLVIVWIQHNRSGWTIFGDRTGFGHTLFWSALACFAVFAALEFLPPFYSYDGGELQFGRMILLPLSLLAILVQTGAEEMLYRGYLQQQIAARFQSPMIWMVAPNILFAIAHLDLSGDPILSLQYVAWTFVFGLACSDLTARTGSLAAAMGFHFANNAYVFLFWAEEFTPDSGLALLLFPEWDGAAAPEAVPLIDLIFLSDLALPLVLWLAVRLAIRR